MKKIILIILAVLMTTTLVWAADIWYCPMHTHYTSDKPGQCPICGMDLVKRQPIDKIQGSAKVKGYAPIVIAEPTQKLMGLKTVEVLKRSLTKTFKIPGYSFRNNTPYLWAYADILESDILLIHVGQKVSVEIPTLDKTVEGVVRWIAPEVDTQTRTVKVRIEMPKLRMVLKSNMYLNISFSLILENSLVIPRDAVMMTGMRSIVFIKNKQNEFIPQEVKTSQEADGYVQIKEGLHEGQMIALGANFLVDSESKLKAALSRIGGHSHGE